MTDTPLQSVVIIFTKLKPYRRHCRSYERNNNNIVFNIFSTHFCCLQGKDNSDVKCPIIAGLACYYMTCCIVDRSPEFSVSRFATYNGRFSRFMATQACRYTALF